MTKNQRKKMSDELTGRVKIVKTEKYIRTISLLLFVWLVSVSCVLVGAETDQEVTFSCSIPSQQCTRTRKALCEIFPPVLARCVWEYLELCKKVSIPCLFEPKGRPLICMYWFHVGGVTANQVREALRREYSYLGGAVDIMYEYEEDGIVKRMTNRSFSSELNRRENPILMAGRNYRIVKVDREAPVLPPLPGRSIMW